MVVLNAPVCWSEEINDVFLVLRVSVVVVDVLVR
jgi:hypothetical protein